MSHPRYTLSTAKHQYRPMMLERSERSVRGIIRARWSERANPGSQPGMADHAPSQVVEVGEGPVRSTEVGAIFATSGISVSSCSRMPSVTLDTGLSGRL